MSYTVEQEAKMRSMYESASTDAERKQVVDSLCEELKATRASVIGKLSNMKIYVKPNRTTKSGDPIVQKLEYVNSIRIMLGARDHELESLEKATKRDLQVIMERLVALSEKVNLSSGR